MQSPKVKEQGARRPSSGREAAALKHIDAILHAYQLDALVSGRGGPPPAQLALPLTPESRHLPRGFLPVSAFELCQKCTPLCALHPMPGLSRASAGELVLAYYEHVADGRGRFRPIIFVHPEHLDDVGTLTSAGQFAALRELARLIAAPFGVPHGKPLSHENCTVRINAGDYLRHGFFDDPLNRWAMALGCPCSELSVILRKEWGSLPVSRRALAGVTPIFPEEPFARERAFFERQYQGLTLDELFGLDKHAVLAWARHNGLLET